MSEDKKGGLDIKLITLSKYIKPAPVVNTSKGYVLNGRNNSFYDYIINCNNGSTTNSSVNSSYSDLIYGRGIGAHNALTNANDWAKFKTILKDGDARRIVNDFQIFGEASKQIIKTKGGGLSAIKHIRKELVAPGIVNEDYEIDSYWFSTDWSRLSQNPAEVFSSFGTSKDAIEIYNIKPYQSGSLYFAQPSYFSALQYCEIEEEMSNLYLSSIKNGLSAGFIIEIINGINLQPDEKDAFEKQVRNHLTGSSNASQFILSFNGVDTEVRITPIPTNPGIHKQWDFLNENAVQKILTAHKATSPSLVGIVSSSGFSNTADEMDMAESQLMKRVIEPKQRYILDALEEVLTAYDINLDLYFKPLTGPIEAPTQLTATVKESDLHCNHEKKKDDLDAVLEMYALDAPEGYDLTDGAEFDLQLASTSKSNQDTDKWKVRYRYAKGTSKSPEGKSRQFCNKMMSLSSSGKVYREEDILKMGKDGVNGKFAHTGNSYNIFLYGGGVNCYHRWERVIFKKKEQENGDLFGGNPMQNVRPVSVSEAKRQGAKLPKNPADVAIAEIDKPNKGKYVG